MNRHDRRALGKQLGKGTTDLLDMMLNPGTECLTCKKPYDKLNREMVTTWSVEIFKKDKLVKLYCPECYEAKNGK